MPKSEDAASDRPEVTQGMIDAGIAAFLKVDPEDSWERLVRDVFLAMSAESPRRSCQAGALRECTSESGVESRTDRLNQ